MTQILPVHARVNVQKALNGPRGDFAAYVGWVLVDCGFPFTICPTEEDITRPTPDAEPSQPPRMERMPVPTREPEPAAMIMPDKKTEPTITPEPKNKEKSDPVCEPATPQSVPVGVVLEFVGMEWSPAHTPAAWGELQLASECNHYEEVEEDISLNLPSPLVPPSSKSPASSKIPPRHPLPPPLPKTASSSALPLLFPFRPLAPPLNSLCCVDLICLLVSSSTLSRGSPGFASSC
ncbi:hypothetical protein DPX16_6131 [Anabarilius grahami]|uniref:Uncharacterized protein n=1 Tax=Anabarilius grahami TaxID=495550 RepID=A0A3N0Z1M7_ANAGA|nr:hypothetical protein DPX16_6131 [Anabarilius grahami]